jgi:glycosylphosphatidylinositol transamidase (GPIT) subunit GPI8
VNSKTVTIDDLLKSYNRQTMDDVVADLKVEQKPSQFLVGRAFVVQKKSFG